MVKVQNVKGLAAHSVPESCVGAGNRIGEALTGGGAGPVLSRERYEPLWGTDPVRRWGRPHRGARYRECPRDRKAPKISSMSRNILKFMLVSIPLLQVL
jgi:hypothetical protein